MQEGVLPSHGSLLLSTGLPGQTLHKSLPPLPLLHPLPHSYVPMPQDHPSVTAPMAFAPPALLGLAL